MLKAIRTLFLISLLLTACASSALQPAATTGTSTLIYTTGLTFTELAPLEALGPEVWIATVVLMSVPASLNSEEQFAKDCIDSGGLPIVTPPDPYTPGNHVCDYNHLLKDGGDRVSNRVDSFKALRDAKKDPTGCMSRLRDGAVLLLFEGVSYTSSLHPDRKAYSGVWGIYNPNTTTNNVTVGGWRNSAEKEIGGYQDFTPDDMSKCESALQIIKGATNYIGANQGWGGSDW